MKEIRNNIDKMIMEQIKLRNKDKAEVYKAIKNAFLVHRTAKNAKPIDDTVEIEILQKLVKQREDAAMQFEQGNRPDLAEKEKYEASVIMELLPAIPTSEDVENYISENYPDGILKNQMGISIKNIKATLSGVDGKLVADIVKTHLV